MHPCGSWICRPLWSYQLMSIGHTSKVLTLASPTLSCPQSHERRLSVRSPHRQHSSFFMAETKEGCPQAESTAMRTSTGNIDFSLIPDTPCRIRCTHQPPLLSLQRSLQHLTGANGGMADAGSQEIAPGKRPAVGPNHGKPFWNRLQSRGYQVWSLPGDSSTGRQDQAIGYRRTNRHKIKPASWPTIKSVTLYSAIWRSIS